MRTFSCLIVDDEPIARDIIQTYCNHLNYLQVVDSCGNAIEAKQVLGDEEIDILFLDINMPIIDGLSFLKTLKRPPQVIFTTAYREYAVEAFEVAACDYLLKPFSFDRFIVAIDKAVERLQALPSGLISSEESKSDNHLFIKAEGKIFKISFVDILFAEAKGNYTRIVTTQNVLLPAMSFSNFERMLPATEFMRVHRSYIINKSRISHIEGNRVFVGETEIPIGTNFKDGFLKELGFS